MVSVSGLLWDYLQQRRIRENTASIEASKTDINIAETDLQKLKAKVETLTLVCESMWELLSSRLSVSESELIEKIQEVDLKDGSLDGKITKIKTCPDCDRVANAKHQNCIYCGHTLISISSFDKL